jgi:hypothetical protein
MQSTYVVTGILSEDTVRLDESLPLGQCRVRVTVEVLGAVNQRPHMEVMEEIYERQRQRGHVPRTREEIDADIDAERESWGD